MKGIQFLEYTRHSDVKELIDSSKVLLDEILELLYKIDVPDDAWHKLWITLPRESFDKYVKSEYKYEDVNTIQDFLEEFPDENMWFSIGGVRQNNIKVLMINNRLIQIDETSRIYNGFCWDCDEFFTCIRDAIADIFNNGIDVYNSKVKNELPYKFRYGIISRKEYWSTYPEDKEKWLEGLKEDEIKTFIECCNNYTNEPSNVLSEMTFRKYMEIAEKCYIRMNRKVYDDVVDTFFANAEDFGGGILRNDIDFDSTKDFDDCAVGRRLNMGGHPWGLIRGSSRTRIRLFPKHKDNGYYLLLGGNPNWNVCALVRSFLALKDAEIPFRISFPEEIVDYLEEKDYIGIVPEHRMPVYCQTAFPDSKIEDFRSFDSETDNQLIDKIAWRSIKEVKLKQ